MSDQINNNSNPNVGCLGFFCAIIAFFGTWIFAFVTFNFFGLVLGWIPAIIVAVVVYFASYFALVVIFIICLLIVLVIVLGLLGILLGINIF